MRLRRYCVTVMGNWYPTRTFFTFSGALKYAAEHSSASHLHVWHAGSGTWHEIQRVWLRNIHDR